MVMELSRSLNFTPNFVVPNEEYYGKRQGHILALFSLITPSFFCKCKGSASVTSWRLFPLKGPLNCINDCPSPVYVHYFLVFFENMAEFYTEGKRVMGWNDWDASGKALYKKFEISIKCTSYFRNFSIKQAQRISIILS